MFVVKGAFTVISHRGWKVVGKNLVLGKWIYTWLNGLQPLLVESSCESVILIIKNINYALKEKLWPIVMENENSF